MMYGLEPHVVRGMISRTAPGPWSVFYVHPDEEDGIEPENVEHVEPRLEIRDATGTVVAVMPPVVEHYENASVILAALGMAQDYVNARTMLGQVDNALRQAGIEYPLGHRGVSDLAVQRDGARDEEDNLREQIVLLRAEAVQAADAIRDRDRKMQGVRTLLSSWSRRNLGPEAAELYRELVSVVMTSIPSPPADDHTPVPSGWAGVQVASSDQDTAWGLEPETVAKAFGNEHEDDEPTAGELMRSRLRRIGEHDDDDQGDGIGRPSLDDLGVPKRGELADLGWDGSVDTGVPADYRDPAGPGEPVWDEGSRSYIAAKLDPADTLDSDGSVSELVDMLNEPRPLRPEDRQ